eukprot:10992077-Lingulodinium_polyedra.AAC.1
MGGAKTGQAAHARNHERPETHSRNATNTRQQQQHTRTTKQTHNYSNGRAPHEHRVLCQMRAPVHACITVDATARAIARAM